ncbi:MAG: hypothetical protein LBJ72_00890 [Dysgonamonadaceae bacterium]|jgi:hypothetical protein|nr:hypothetical protein [Dysgonamonadaceae bacterium]
MKIKNKILIPTLSMLLCSIVAFADDYNVSAENVVISTSGTHTITGITTTHTIVVTGSGTVADITIQDVNIDVSGTNNACAFSIADGATVNLTLSGNNVLKSGDKKAGLEVPDGTTLRITGTSGDKLEATGNFGAGIGGSYQESGGDITISGGTVTATGGIDGAGIGGGMSGGGGDITISGGMVTATGGLSAAGIGGGLWGSSGTITISGGTVAAYGGYYNGEYRYGAGIGGGQEGSGGIITISDGIVEATGGRFSAGIGTGDDGYNCIIIISGGTVEAKGGDHGAGIGGGLSSYGNDITISGGTVTATGGSYGAGIGTSTGDNYRISYTISISGGTIEATGGDNGAGIGIGSYSTSTPYGDITISGGTVEAIGGINGAGIGGGLAAPGGDITINGGTVTAKGGDNSADIGVGNDYDSDYDYQGSGGSITIRGGSISAGSINIQPTNGNEENVYLNTFTVGAGNDEKLIMAGSIDGVDCATIPDVEERVYGIKDAKTDSDSKAYFYLPASDGDELVTLTVAGNSYGKSYTREEDKSYTQTLLPPYDISLSETGTYIFTAASYGYTAQTLEVEVSNVGYKSTGLLNVELSGIDAGNLFTLSVISLNSIAPDGNRRFTVKPKTGLSVGTYTATVIVSNTNVGSKSFDVSFEVTQKTITVTPNAGQSKPYGQPDPELTYTCDPALVAGDEFTGALSRVAGEDQGTYLIERGSLVDPSGNYDLTFTTDVLFTITPPTNPRLLQDLEDAIVCIGESHTFEIVAEGYNLSYEWYYGNERIKGANGNTCTITNAELRDYERYYVIVRSQSGDYRSSVYSKNVRFWVAGQLPESLQFVDFPSTVFTGNTYRIKLAGYPDVTQYVWSYDRDGVTFSPETGGIGDNETLATFGLLSAGQGTLTVTLEHPCGTRQATQPILVNYPTGVEPVAGTGIEVFPNPTAGLVNVTNTHSGQPIRMTGVSGSLTRTYQAREGVTTIDLTGYAKGVYLLHYNGKVVKVVKQ